MIDKNKLQIDLTKIYKSSIIVTNIFVRSDNRLMVTIKINNKFITNQYARFLLEIELGRCLTVDETVDHIDNDVTNDSISNLQLLSKSENSKKEMIRRKSLNITYEISHELRMVRKHNFLGEKNINAKFSDFEVIRYRKLVASNNITVKEIELETNISSRSIRNMLDGTTYSHLPYILPKIRNRKV